jgi:hypothetical protein
VTGAAASDDRSEPSLAANTIVSFDEDGCGRVLMTSLAGPVYRVVDGAPSPCGPATPPPTPTGTPGCAATIRLAGRVRLRSLRRRGLKVRVSSRVACSVSGSLRAAGRRSPAKKVTLVPGARRTLRLKPARAARPAVRRAVKRHGRARMVLRLTLRRVGAPRAVTRRVRVLVV